MKKRKKEILVSTVFRGQRERKLPNLIEGKNFAWHQKPIFTTVPCDKTGV